VKLFMYFKIRMILAIEILEPHKLAHRNIKRFIYIRYIYFATCKNDDWSSYYKKIMLEFLNPSMPILKNSSILISDIVKSLLIASDIAYVWFNFAMSLNLLYLLLMKNKNCEIFSSQFSSFMHLFFCRQTIMSDAAKLHFYKCSDDWKI